LSDLARKYDKTQNQILLNWLVKHKQIRPLVKTTDISRIKENLESLNFDISVSDYKILDDFRSQEFDQIKIDWENTGDGVVIHQLPNQLM
jgi:diketogulonate reductase-like aldo/keto reductase